MSKFAIALLVTVFGLSACGDKEAVNVYKRIASFDVEESKYARERLDQLKGQTPSVKGR